MLCLACLLHQSDRHLQGEPLLVSLGSALNIALCYIYQSYVHPQSLSSIPNTITLNRYDPFRPCPSLPLLS